MQHITERSLQGETIEHRQKQQIAVDRIHEIYEVAPVVDRSREQEQIHFDQQYLQMYEPPVIRVEQPILLHEERYGLGSEEVSMMAVENIPLPLRERLPTRSEFRVMNPVVRANVGRYEIEEIQPVIAIISLPKS